MPTKMSRTTHLAVRAINILQDRISEIFDDAKAGFLRGERPIKLTDAEWAEVRSLRATIDHHHKRYIAPEQHPV